MLLSELTKLMPNGPSLEALAEIYDGLAEAIEYAKVGEHEFMTSREKQAAIMYRLAFAGEAAKRFCDRNLESPRQRGTSRLDSPNPDISKVSLSRSDWDSLIKIRDHLNHELDQLDLQRVWKLVADDAPQMLEAVFDALTQCTPRWLDQPGSESKARARRDINGHFCSRLQPILSAYQEALREPVYRLLDEIRNDTHLQLRSFSREYVEQINALMAESSRQIVSKVNAVLSPSPRSTEDGECS